MKCPGLGQGRIGDIKILWELATSQVLGQEHGGAKWFFHPAPWRHTTACISGTRNGEVKQFAQITQLEMILKPGPSASTKVQTHSTFLSVSWCWKGRGKMQVKPPGNKGALYSFDRKEWSIPVGTLKRQNDGMEGPKFKAHFCHFAALLQSKAKVALSPLWAVLSCVPHYTRLTPHCTKGFTCLPRPLRSFTNFCSFHLIQEAFLNAYYVHTMHAPCFK